MEYPAVVSQILSMPGAPLSNDDRAFFEPLFGRDFSGVRVHDGSQASAAGRAVGARAFAFGEHLVFDGKPDRRMMSHELAHVAQQQGLLAGSLSRFTDRSSEPEERAASRVAEEILSGRTRVDPGRAESKALRKDDGGRGSRSAEDMARTAELLCSFDDLCRLSVSNPEVMTKERLKAAAKKCNYWGVQFPLIESPCLNIPSSSLRMPPAYGPGPRRASPSGMGPPSPQAAPPAAPGKTLEERLTFKANFGGGDITLKIPKSLTANLKIPPKIRGASIFTVSLSASATGSFSLSLSTNLTRTISLSAGSEYSIKDKKFTTKLTLSFGGSTCQADSPLALKQTISEAGKKLQQSVNAIAGMQQPDVSVPPKRPAEPLPGQPPKPAETPKPMHELLVDAASAFFDIYDAVDKATSKCSAKSKYFLEARHEQSTEDDPTKPPESRASKSTLNFGLNF
jgi:hypothetical protein